jgi:hypothetical protein
VYPFGVVCGWSPPMRWYRPQLWRLAVWLLAGSSNVHGHGAPEGDKGSRNKSPTSETISTSSSLVVSATYPRCLHRHSPSI